MLYPKSNKLNTRYWHVYAKTSAKQDHSFIFIFFKKKLLEMI